MNIANVRLLKLMENSQQGTPKTLNGAIENGLTSPSIEDPVTAVEQHVRDFFNQKLAILMLSSDPGEVRAAEKLYLMLIGSK